MQTRNTFYPTEMADHTSILVFGRDPSLLETRTWVLQGAGFEVSSTTEVEQAVRTVTCGEASLTILCHSLTLEQRAPVFEAARASKRKPKLLALTGGIDGIPEGAGIVLLSPFDGPRALIDTVKRMLIQA